MAKFGVIYDKSRLVMLEDLVETEGRIVDKLEIKRSKVYKTKPSHCPSCKCKTMNGIEIMGGYDGVLFWECDDCEEMFLKFKEDETEEYLQLAKGVWTNPSDWGYIPRYKFN